MKLTVKAVQQELSAIGVSFRSLPDSREYRVVVKGKSEDCTYYTDNLQDALDTGKSMVISNHMTPRFKTHQRVKLGSAILRISAIDSFGSTQHYGIVWSEDDIKWNSGWIPCIIFDAIATEIKG